MPPPHNDPTIDIAKLHYTDQNIQILHEIVSLATAIVENSGSRKQSFRNIWRAYDAVCAHYDIDKSHDNVYFRVIYHLQKTPGDDLHAKFVQFLEEVGVDVEHTTFADVPAEITAEYNRSRFEDARKRRNRAISSEEEEGYQGEDESVPRRILSTDKTTETAELRVGRGRPSARSTSPHDDAVRAANQAARARRDELKRRREPSSSASDVGDLAGKHGQVVVSPRVPEDAADHLYALQLRALARKYFRHWHAATVKQVVRRQYLEERAAAFDRQKLLGQSFDIWQEQRWFASVGRRAEARYNEILLAKAWTTWVRRTAAIVQRTHEVRQRILARKYFNAWREVVLENEANVRWFKLSRVFYKWRDKLAQKREMDETALAFCDTSLAYKIYWQWFLKACGNLGYRRYKKELLEGVIYKWSEKAEKITQLKRMADAFYRHRTLQAVFGLWLNKLDTQLALEDEAEDHRDWRLAQQTLAVWRRQAMLNPLKNVMQEFVNDRVLYTHYSLWRQHTRDNIVSAELYSGNLVKRTFYTWRLQLRERALVDYDEQVLKRAILKRWVIHERLKLLERTNARRLVKRTLRLFATRLRERHAVLTRAELALETWNNRRLAVQVLSWWQHRLNEQRQLASDASQYHDAHCASTALVLWRDRTANTRTLDTWATDAAYYFVCKRVLTHWAAAATASRKARLKSAYSTVVRRRKRALAAATFSLWREKTESLLLLSDLAADFTDSRVRDLAALTLDYWRAKSEAMQMLSTTARNMDALRIARSAWATWMQQLRHVKELEDIALAARRERDAKLAARYLRRWGVRFWDVGMLRERGEMWAQRTQALRAHSLFRLWRDRARFDVHQPHPQLEPEGAGEVEDEGAGGVGTGTGNGDTTARIRALEAFSEVFPPGPSLPSRPSVSFRASRSQAPLLTTPGWRSARRRPVLAARTPVGTPGSPLRRLNPFRASVLGRVAEPEEEG